MDCGGVLPEAVDELPRKLECGEDDGVVIELSGPTLVLC